MKCSACGKDKNQLLPRKSRLSPTQTLLLCTECIDAKREPRYLIIIHGRANGFASVAEYIRTRRYVGDAILAEDFT